jgi:4-hydroxybenzoate polyprenyltransferase
MISLAKCLTSSSKWSPLVTPSKGQSTKYRDQNSQTFLQSAAERPYPTLFSIRCLPQLIVRIQNILHNAWLFTKDDTPTFVIPNTVFGLCAALSGSCLISSTHDIHSILFRIPWVFLFNWTNLLVFDLANQRLPESAKEDTLNKPWRPIPSGRLTGSQVRQCMLVAIPLVLLFNHVVLNVGTETALLYMLTWLYNDLKGGDEGWIVRNVIIAFAFGLYNLGSLKVAASERNHDPNILSWSSTVHVSQQGYTWILFISGVILTTMHVQDLKDVKGDAARERKTAPLVLGERAARWTIAVPIVIWSGLCASFWRLSWIPFAPAAILGWYVAWRCLNFKGNKVDRKTWQLWCLWTAVLYVMPLLGR